MQLVALASRLSTVMLFSGLNEPVSVIQVTPCNGAFDIQPVAEVDPITPPKLFAQVFAADFFKRLWVNLFRYEKTLLVRFADEVVAAFCASHFAFSLRD